MCLTSTRLPTPTASIRHAYAQYEDDFKRIEQNYLWATGQLASVEDLPLASDIRARLFMTQAEAINAYQVGAAEVKSAL